MRGGGGSAAGDRPGSSFKRCSSLLGIVVSAVTRRLICAGALYVNLGRVQISLIGDETLFFKYNLYSKANEAWLLAAAGCLALLLRGVLLSLFFFTTTKHRSIVAAAAAAAAKKHERG